MKTRKLLVSLLIGTLLFTATACTDDAPSSSSQAASSGQSSLQSVSSAADDDVFTEIESGTITYSHGCIEKPKKYPYWEAVSLNNETGEQKPLVAFDGALYLEGDTERETFLASDSQACPSEKYDLLYIYTMPYDAMVNIELTSKVQSELSNGIKVYCYLNDPSQPLVKEAVVTSQEGTMIHGAYAAELKKGDKVYCGYNANGSADNDGGNFYVKLTYITVDK